MDSSYAIRTESLMPWNGIGAIHFILIQDEVIVKKELDKSTFCITQMRIIGASVDHAFFRSLAFFYRTESKLISQRSENLPNAKKTQCFLFSPS